MCNIVTGSEEQDTCKSHTLGVCGPALEKLWIVSQEGMADFVAFTKAKFSVVPGHEFPNSGSLPPSLFSMSRSEGSHKTLLLQHEVRRCQRLRPCLRKCRPQTNPHTMPLDSGGDSDLSTAFNKISKVNRLGHLRILC